MRQFENYKYINDTFGEYSSFSGADIKAFIFVPQEKKGRLFAELQTISISSHREIVPVRRLGETAVKDYSRGSRTIAGSLIFSILNKDVFDQFSKTQDSGEVDNYDLPIYTDKLPPFNITITAVNEFRASARTGVFGVRIVDYGMTMSINDLITESTYSYVARYMKPLTDSSDYGLEGSESVGCVCASDLMRTG